MKYYLPYFAGIGVALTWGMSFIFTKGALDYLDPFHLLGLRFAMAIAAMSLLRVAGIIKFSVTPNDYVKFIPLTFFQPILYFSTETIGILLTSASYAGMMIAISPIIVAILAAAILGERPNSIQIIFILTSISGVVTIIYMDNQNSFSINSLGTIVLLGTVTAAACYNISSRKASTNYSPLQITWVMMVIGAVVFNSISLFQHFTNGAVVYYLKPISVLWPTIFYLGVVSSVAAFFMYNFVLSKITATQGAVFNNLVTVVAISAGVMFLGELVYWYHLAGTAAILIGVWGTNYYTPALKVKRKQLRIQQTREDL